MLDGNLAGADFDEGLSSPKAYGCIAAIDGEEGAEVISHAGVDVQDSVHCIVAYTREGLEHTVARHCPCIPGTALIFVERIADAAVIPVETGAHDVKALLHVAFEHQMGGNLELYSCPDLIAVYERQAGFPPLGQLQRSRPPSCPKANPGRWGLETSNRSFLRLYL